MRDCWNASGGGLPKICRSFPQPGSRNVGNNWHRPISIKIRSCGRKGVSAKCHLNATVLINLDQVAWKKLSVERPETPNDTRKQH